MLLKLVQKFVSIKIITNIFANFNFNFNYICFFQCAKRDELVFSPNLSGPLHSLLKLAPNSSGSPRSENSLSILNLDCLC